MNIDVNELSQIIRLVDGNHSLGAGALAEAILDHLPAPQIIRTVEELEALDGVTVIGTKDGYTASATELRLFVRPHNANKYLPAVVIGDGSHVRSCWTALERN
jgi:hypothetical protein